MRSRLPTVAFAALAFGLLGNDACFMPRAQVDDSIIGNPDARCAALGGTYPAGFAFDQNPETSRLWVADRSQFALIPFDVDVMPPVPSADIAPFFLPADSDSNDASDEPLIEGIQISTDIAAIIGGTVGFVTAISYEVVLLFDPFTGSLWTSDVSVPEIFAPEDYPDLPAPGVVARTQTGFSTRACIRPLPGALDSQGGEIEIASPCDASDPRSYYSSSTSGVAAISGVDPDGGQIFVSVANPGVGAGSETPPYLPGAVLVFGLSESAGIHPLEEPTAHPSVIFTEGFNPTHVTGYSVGSRSFVLVTVSGAIGTVPDDPATPDVVEGGFTALTGSAIEVIDADTLELVAIIPLGKAALAGGLAIEPNGPRAVVGSAAKRWLLAVDLTPLAASDFPSEGPPVVLDGTAGFGNAVLHDAENRIEIDPLGNGGADPRACPGSTAGFAYNDAGTRIYVTDFCDGSLTTLVAATFAIEKSEQITGPIDGEDLVTPRGPVGIAVRPGVPGVDFTGPDVFVLIAEHEGLVCGLDIESDSGSP